MDMCFLGEVKWEGLIVMWLNPNYNEQRWASSEYSMCFYFKFIQKNAFRSCSDTEASVILDREVYISPLEINVLTSTSLSDRKIKKVNWL